MQNEKKKTENKLSRKNVLTGWENIEVVKENNDNKKISIADEFIMEDNWESNEEEIYKDEIVKQSWIKDNIYLNVDQIKNSIPSFHYLDKHCSLLESALPEKTLETF